ncbi:MAG TPA: HAMP domain-containing protein, partial [Steroidobacteraceae bacterium]|nr:HAMP domain-containing protein [Steroidobacteraceae bacterium]
MPSSLRTKTLLIAAAIVLSISGLLGGLGYLEHRADGAAASALAHGAVARSLESELEARASVFSQEAATQLQGPLAAGDVTAIAAVGRRMFERTGVARVEVRDRAGRLLFAESHRAPPSGAGAPYSVAAPVTAPIDGGIRRVGSVMVSLSRADSERALTGLRIDIARDQALQANRFAVGLLGLSGLMLVVGLGGAWFFADGLIRPIAQLARSAERIGRGDYSSPQPIRRNDEIGDLQATLE